MTSTYYIFIIVYATLHTYSQIVFTVTSDFSSSYSLYQQIFLSTTAN